MDGDKKGLEIWFLCSNLYWIQFFRVLSICLYHFLCCMWWLCYVIYRCRLFYHWLCSTWYLFSPCEGGSWMDWMVSRWETAFWKLNLFFFSFPFWLWTHQSCVMVGFAFDFGRLWSCLIDPHKGFMSTTSNKWLALLSHECTEECVKAFQLPLWSLQEDGGRCFLSLVGTKKLEWNCYCLVKQLLLGMLRVNLIKLCPLGLLPSQVRVDSNAIFIFSRILPFSTTKSLSPINWSTF